MLDNVRNLVAGLAVTLSSAALCTAASAATMNFDLLPDEGAQLASYSENGIKATAIGGVLAYEGQPGYAHIDDSGTGLAYGLDFNMGGLFDAVGFSLISFGYDFLGAPGPLSDNVFVSGYIGNALVSSTSFILSDIAGTAQAIQLGQGFLGIDRLRIELLYPNNTAACGAPCGHFDLDWITLNGPAAVPLPATLGTFVAAGVMLAGVTRRRRVRQTA